MVPLLFLLAGCESYVPPQALEPFASQKPLVVLFATDAASTLAGSMDDGLVGALRAEGYELFAMDLPCHDGGPLHLALACWRTRIEGGDSDLFTRYCRELSAELTRQGVTKAIAIGQSRGGYVATTCAAYDFRFSAIVLLKPVTDLQKLVEFDGYAVDQTYFGLTQYAPALLGRPLSILIGANDTRVSTESAVRFAIAVGAEIELTDSVDHFLPGDGATSSWVLDRL
jgi:pimeloyl-ACP methyl ester carboxylesterase